ncbi:hypothetical protein RUND412_003900 [Rhizina undulata]
MENLSLDSSVLARTISDGGYVRPSGTLLNHKSGDVQSINEVMSCLSMAQSDGDGFAAAHSSGIYEWRTLFVPFLAPHGSADDGGIREPIDYGLCCDGAAGSTLQNIEVPPNWDPEDEEIALAEAANNPMPPPPPPKIKKERKKKPYSHFDPRSRSETAELMEQYKDLPPEERKRKIQEDREMRARFNKGKERKERRIRESTAIREGSIFPRQNTEDLRAVEAQNTVLHVLQAYEKADEQLFGQKRFEEVEEEEDEDDDDDEEDTIPFDDSVVQDAPQARRKDIVKWTSRQEQKAIAAWQKEMGVVDVVKKEQKERDQLQRDIQRSIREVELEKLMREKEEKRQRELRALQNKHKYEDVTENLVMDHQATLVEKEREIARKRMAHEDTKMLKSTKHTDIAANLVLDHEFALADKNYERDRKEIAKLYIGEIKKEGFSDITEKMAIDHQFKLADESQENLRKQTGAKQTGEMRKAVFFDMAVNFKHAHEFSLATKMQDAHRAELQKLQSAKRQRQESTDIVENIVLQHQLQIANRYEEQARNELGRSQTADRSSVGFSDATHNVAAGFQRNLEDRKRKFHEELDQPEIIREETDELSNQILMSIVSGENSGSSGSNPPERKRQREESSDQDSAASGVPLFGNTQQSTTQDFEAATPEMKQDMSPPPRPVAPSAKANHHAIMMSLLSKGNKKKR